MAGGCSFAPECANGQGRFLIPSISEPLADAGSSDAGDRERIRNGRIYLLVPSVFGECQWIERQGMGLAKGTNLAGERTPLVIRRGRLAGVTIPTLSLRRLIPPLVAFGLLVVVGVGFLEKVEATRVLSLQEFPAPFASAQGKWIRLAPLGPVWIPKTRTGWAPFVDGAWHHPAGSIGPVWVSKLAWEDEAARRGRWTRAATWGWVWSESTSAKAAERSVPVAFFSIPGAEPMIGWIALGPHDNLARLERLEGTGGTLKDASLENLRAPFRVSALPLSNWPKGEVRYLTRLPKGIRLVDPRSLVVREGVEPPASK